jgi:RNA polymerase sigma-70 factor (ECF subfamily)
MPDQNVDIAALLYSVGVNNDEPSYKRLFELFFPPLKKFSWYFLRSREMAEEAASDTMFALWENRGKLMEIENIRVWLYVIARNKCLNMLKSSQSKVTFPLDESSIAISFPGKDPAELCINSEIRRKIEKAINTLPGRCKLIFKLVKEEGLSYKEVGAILDISPKTVDAQLVTALKKITQAIRLEYSV